MTFEESYRNYKKKQESSGKFSMQSKNEETEQNLSFEESYRRWKAPQIKKEIAARTDSLIKNSNTFLQNARTRSNNTANTYVSDSGEWLSKITGQHNDLTQESGAIKNMLGKYRKYLDSDWANQIDRVLTDGTAGRESVISSYQKENDYWNSFANEEEYKTFIKDQEHKRYLLKDFNPDEAQKEANSLQKEIDDFYNTYEWSRDMRQKIYQGKFSEENLEAAFKGYTFAASDEEKIKAKEEYDLFLKTREKEKYLSSLAKDIENSSVLRKNAAYEELENRPDFNKKSIYQKQIPNLDEYVTQIALTQSNPIGQNELGQIKNKASFLQNPELLYEIINAKTDESRVYYIKKSGLYGDFSPNSLEYATYMSDEERKRFNFLYDAENKEGDRKEAIDYFTFLRDNYLEGRELQNYREKWAAYGKEHPFAGNVVSVPANLMSGAEQLVRYANYAVTEKPEYNRTSLMSSSIRGASTENINNDVLGYLYNIGMSTVDSFASAAMPGKAGGIALGGSAASQSWNEGIDRGLSGEQLVLGSLAAGVCECVFESISIGNLKALKEINPSSVKDIAMNMLKSTVVNASEETATEIGNIICDTIISGNMSEWYTSIQKYIDEDGMSFEDAKSKVFGEKVLQVLEAGASGALQGGIMSGAVSGRNAYSGRKTGKYANENIVSAVKELGLTTDPNSRAYHMAQGLSAESKNLYKGATIAEVLNEVYGNQTVSVVEQMLKDGGYEGKNLTETAREFLSSAENSDMSRKVVRAIGDNVELMKVWQKLTNSALIDTDAIAASLKDAGIQEKHADVLARTMALSAQNKTSDSYLESFLGNEKVAEIYKEVQNEIEQGKTAERFIPNGENRLGAKMIEERLRALAEKRVENEHKQQINKNQNQTGISDMPSLTDQQIADIKNVKITDNGQIMVETDSGEANLFDLPLPDDSIDVIANSVKYGNSAKIFFTSFIHGQDPTKYDQNFFRIYLMAGEGFSLEQIGKAYPEVFDGMFPPQIEMAFRSGYYDKRTHVQQAHEAIKKKAAKAKESGAKARTGAVDTSVVDAWMKKTGNRLTKKQKAEIEAGRVIASEIGIDVKYVVNFQDANGKNVGMIDPVTGKISGANGEISFREETGKIEMILDINAGLSNFTTKEGQASILRAMSHELTHFIEKMSPRMYQDLQEFMIQNIDFGEDSFHGLVAQKMESLKISETQAIREVIANACETMLGDSDVMTKLYEQNAGLGDRIRNWLSKKIRSIDRAIARIREIFRKAAEGDTAQYAESKALTANLEGYRQALQKWETALLDAAQNYQNGGLVQSGDSAQYSIRYTTDNRPVVVVQEDILDGVPKSQWVKTVKDTISGKFANGIPVKGRLVKVNAVTRNEYMNSKYTKRMFKSGNNIYADKLKSANNLDEIILASTNYINEDLKHVRKDNFKEFARGDILLRVGNHDYSAKVIIGITPKNNMVLYDIINFTQTSISLKNKRDSRKGYAESRKPKGYAESRKPMPDGVSFDSSISQNDSDVNNQYMQNRGKNSEQFVKYSIREGMTDDERYTELKNKTIQIPKSVDTKPYRQNLQQIENKAKSKAEKIIYSLAEELGILNRKLSAPELEMEFTFTKNNGLKESLSKQIDYGGNYSDFAKALLNLDNILKNAVLIERHKDKYKGTRRENIHLENVSVLLGAFRDGNVIIPVQFEIKKNRNADSKLYVTVAMTKIEAGVMGRRAAQNRAVPNLLPASEYSIAKILSKVNPQDRNFLKYVPDGFLNRTQKKAKDLAIADENEKINALYSEREGNYDRKIIDQAIKDREDIAKALDEIAQTAAEQKILTNYAEGLEQMKEEYINLEKIKRSLNELYDEKKKLSENGEKMPDFYKKKMEIYRKMGLIGRKINAYDKQLLSLEKMDIFRDIVSREKSYARVKQRKKDRAKINREAVKKQIERRVTRLRKAICYPTPKMHIPDILRQPIGQFINTIDFSSDRRLRGGPDTISDTKFLLRLDNLRQAINSYETNQAELATHESETMSRLYLDLPEGFIEEIDEFKNEVLKTIEKAPGENIVNRMSDKRLKELNKILTVLTTATRNVNRLYAGRNNLQDIGESTIKEMDALGKRKPIMGNFQRFLLWENGVPYYIFKRFGTGGQEIFKELMDSNDKLAFHAKTILDFTEKLYTDSEVKEWENEVKEFDLSEGKIHMTVAQQMAFYCLAKREQGIGHLEGGGVGIFDKKQKNAAQKTTLTDQDIQLICDSLEKRPKKIAEELQKFMSTVCAEWGNEISLARFGYSAYTEKNYFPIEVLSDWQSTNPKTKIQNSDIFRLLNLSSSKQITPNANSGIMIRSIFDVFASHSADMARMNAFGLSLLDAIKWLNYKVKTKDENGRVTLRGVKQSINNAYGTSAFQYIMKLMEGINGAYEGADSHTFLDFVSKNMMSAAKTAAVGANFRVGFLQITAAIKAGIVLSRKSLLKVRNFNIAKGVKLAKKHCGIALWKSLGYFDININKGLESMIKGDDSITDKIKEKSMLLAEKGDEWTWGYLWNACEEEIKSFREDLTPDTDAFYQAVADKLREVVYRTQVVDSPLTRTQLMRNKSPMIQGMTAFAAESMLTYNIVLDNVMDFRLETRKLGGYTAKNVWTAFFRTWNSSLRNITLIALTQALVSALQGAFDIWRDEDDEEKTMASFWEYFRKNYIDNINPLSNLPLIKDIYSQIETLWTKDNGSTESLENAGISSLISAVAAWVGIAKNGEESKTTPYGAIYKTIRAFSQISGLPISNAMREVIDLYNNTFANWIPGLSKATRYQKNPKKDTLYRVLISGDKSKIEEIKQEYNSESAYNAAVVSALRQEDKRIRKTAFEILNGNHTATKTTVNEIVSEGHFGRQIVTKAIHGETESLKRNLQNAANAIRDGQNGAYKQLLNDLTETYHGIISKKEIENLIRQQQISESDKPEQSESRSIYKTWQINDALEIGDYTTANEIIADIVSGKIEQLKEDDPKLKDKEAEEKAKTSIRSALTRYWKPLYMAACKTRNMEEQSRIRKALMVTKIYGNSTETMTEIRKWIAEALKEK